MGPRLRQLVSTHVQRRDVLRWILNYEQQSESMHRIAILTVDAFSDVFFNRKNCQNFVARFSGGKIVNQ